MGLTHRFTSLYSGLLFSFLSFFDTPGRPSGQNSLVSRFIFGIIATMGNVFAGLVCVMLLTVGGESAAVPLTANEHPWGHFPKKSWCIVQTAILSNPDSSTVQSVQTVRTTLQSIDENSLTLEESETLEFGGKSVKKQPQIIKVDFFQEPIRENVQIRQGTPAKLLIDKKVIPCSVRIYEQQMTGGHLTTTVWYTPHVYPHVLRVEKIVRSSPNNENAEGQVIRLTVTTVQMTSVLKNLRSSRRNRAYTLQTVEKGGNITKITDARCSWDVPGGLLESTTREFDAQNREIRRSISRMTNYFLDQPSSIGPPSRYYRTWTSAETM